MGIIYKATNKINDKVYIGMTMKTLKDRQTGHRIDANLNRHNMLFHRAIRKYGFNNFDWEIIDEHEDIEVLRKLERLHISRYESNDPFWGYNLTEGGEGTIGLKRPPVSNKTRKKLSIANSGTKNPFYNKKHTKETRKKVDKSWHGFEGTYYAKRDVNPWRKVWASKIKYNKKRNYLGYFEDPLSASIVYQLVLDEIAS